MKGWKARIRILTRTFRLLQVVHPFELPGIPTMFNVGGEAALGLALSIVDTESKVVLYSVIAKKRLETSH